MSLGLLDFLLWFLVLRDGLLNRRYLVMESRWHLVNDRLMHLSLMGSQRSLRLRLSLLRCRLLRMSLLATQFHFFFHKLVVRFRLMISWFLHMESGFVQILLFMFFLILLSWYDWLMTRLLRTWFGLLLFTLYLVTYESFLTFLCLYFLIFMYKATSCWFQMDRRYRCWVNLFKVNMGYHHVMEGWCFVGIVDLDDIVLFLFWLVLLNERNNNFWLQRLSILKLLWLYI